MKKPLQSQQQSPIIKITHDSSSNHDRSSRSSREDNLDNVDTSTRSSRGETINERNQQQQNETNTDINNNNNNDQSVKTLVVEEQTHAYTRRFFVLLIFCAHSAINSFQWIEYSSITNVISEFYGVSNLLVNLTSLVYMITYIPFIIHASYVLEKIGLRKAILLGTFGTALGSLVKLLFGGDPGMTSFWWMMLGQTIVALSQLFIISIPPLLAAVWFPDNQVSTATGVGVFGNQLGIALGFIVPPLIIKDSRAGKAAIESDLGLLSSSVFWISSFICIISIITLEDKPPKPPGSASFHAAHQQTSSSISTTTRSMESHENDISLSKNNNNNKTNDLNVKKHMQTFDSIKELCNDGDFRLLIMSYGLNVGCFYAISTVLNQMVALNWPNLIDLSGTLGLLIVVSGMVGSVVCGQLLDRFHAFKLIIVFIYLFSLLSMVLFTVVIEIPLLGQLWPLYAAAIILGFFMTGYLPLGFEFAAEITYPHPANTPAGLLNLSVQVIITLKAGVLTMLYKNFPMY